MTAAVAPEPSFVDQLSTLTTELCHDLADVDVDAFLHAQRGRLTHASSFTEVLDVVVRDAAMRTAEEPAFALLAGRLLARRIRLEAATEGAHDLLSSVTSAHGAGLVTDELLGFVRDHHVALHDVVDDGRDDLFAYFGLQTLYDRYLLRHPTSRQVLETPQTFFMRIACALSDSVDEAVALYALLSQFKYMPSSPTLFNSGTRHPQLSSCFLMDSPQDTLDDIYRTYADVARLSKFSGGIGLAFHRVRARGSLIHSTNGSSNGIVPWLKTLDSSVAAVNQGGRRKGAACVYLEPWHADIEPFLELRDNTGDEAQRTHNLNLANWIPDLFMQRVADDAEWSLFDPKDVPTLPDLFGDAFNAAYVDAEQRGLAVKTLPARTLYGRMMRTLAQTGNGWMTFKDACNRTCNQTTDDDDDKRTVHLSNLCTEIVEVTDHDATAVCNLGSLNLSRHTVMDDDGQVQFDFAALASSVAIAVRQLDAVIDRNLYPIDKAKRSNMSWRPVGLGLMGLQDVFFQMRLPFDDERALTLSNRISEVIYFEALKASCALARERGKHPSFDDTRAARGELQFDSWGVTPTLDGWEALKADIQAHGLRNSLLCAIAPTATIASIVGCGECTEPQVSNLFKRETLSGDFLQVNRFLVDDLKAAGLWTDATRQHLKEHEGSVQQLDGLDDAHKRLYRTAWELPMRSLIDLAAGRGAFIDQSQSLNLFMESPDISRLSSMYFYAWKSGLKTTYYLRSRPATRIAKATIDRSASTMTTSFSLLPMSAGHRSADALACSLENPESCEACQ